MIHIKTKDAIDNFDYYFNKVMKDRDSISITDSKVVLIPEIDYYLLSNPSMINRLNESIEQYKNNDIVQMPIEELSRYRLRK